VEGCGCALELRVRDGARGESVKLRRPLLVDEHALEQRVDLVRLRKKRVSVVARGGLRRDDGRLDQLLGSPALFCEDLARHARHARRGGVAEQLRRVHCTHVVHDAAALLELKARRLVADREGAVAVIGDERRVRNCTKQQR
jgi:hypothetical protein